MRRSRFSPRCNIVLNVRTHRLSGADLRSDNASRDWRRREITSRGAWMCYLADLLLGSGASDGFRTPTTQCSAARRQISPEMRRLQHSTARAARFGERRSDRLVPLAVGRQRLTDLLANAPAQKADGIAAAPAVFGAAQADAAKAAALGLGQGEGRISGHRGGPE